MQPPGPDDSEPSGLKPGAGARVHVAPAQGATPGDPASVEGLVVAVHPPDRGAVRVELDGGATFTVVLPEGCPLPFGEGDRVSARSRIETRGIHVIRHGSVLDGGGEVLVAFSEDGDPSWAPGWSVEAGPVARAGTASGGLAPRHAHWLVLHHGGHAAWLADRSWRELSSGGHRWAVSAEAVRFELGLPLPPDAAMYDWYIIIRLNEGTARA